MPTTNKIGLPEAQQDMLIHAFGMATRAANIVTCICSPGMKGQEMELLKDLVDYAKHAYPRGPVDLKTQLEELCRRLDIAQIFSATQDGKTL